MCKPNTVLEALELAEKSKYTFDWNNYSPVEFTIQLGLRKKECLDYVRQKNNVDTYKLTDVGIKHLNKYRKRESDCVPTNGTKFLLVRKLSKIIKLTFRL